MAGKVIALRTGETVTIGRASAKAQFALPQDTFLSGLHFAVECGPSGCRVVDRKSSNGTFLNGAKIQDAMLANGDEIKAGQTVFVVKIVSDEKIASMNLSPAPAAPPPPAPARAAEQPVSPPQPSSRVAVPPSPLPEPPAPVPSARLPGASPSPQEMRNQASPSPQSLPAAQPPLPSPLRSEAVDSRPAERAVPPPIAENPPPRRDVEKPPREIEPPARVADLPARARPVDAPQKSASPQQARGVSAFQVKGWSFPAPPAEWEVQQGFGLQRTGAQEFPSSVAVSEEALAGITLQEFVESQISTLRSYLREAKIEPAMPPRIGGADESMGVDVQYSTKDGRELAYRHIYARSGSSVGVLTVTTLASELALVMKSLQPLLDGAAFQPAAPHS